MTVARQSARIVPWALAALVCVPAAADQADCAKRLHTLYAGFIGYAREHGGRMPAQMSELEYLVFVDDLDAFVCPDSRTELTVRTDIDAQTDYEIVSRTLPVAQVIVIAREKQARHGGKRHLLYSDGTVALEGEDPSTGTRPPAGGADGGTRPSDVRPGGGGATSGDGGTRPGGRFTGLLIDASGLGLRRSMSARVLDDRGEVFYPDPRMSDQVPAKGWLGFIKSPADVPRSRAGANPFVVRAVRLSTDRPTEVVLAEADIGRIRTAEARSGFLDEWNVTLLIGEDPMPHGPTPVGAEGPPLTAGPGGGGAPGGITQPPPTRPGGGETPVRPTGPPSPTRWNLTGQWKDNLDRQYQIRQVGDKVYWSMEDRPRIVTSFYGLLEDDVLAGERVDVPGGQAQGGGVLMLRVESNDRMTRLQDRTDLGASQWTRAVAGPAQPDRTDQSDQSDQPDLTDRPDTPVGPVRPGVEGGPLPAGLSVAEDLAVARWMAIRPLTHLKREDGLKINSVKLSGDGSKIIFSTYTGTYVMNAEGSGRVQLSDQRNDELIDISASGSKVAWLDKSGLYTADSDGAGKVQLPSELGYPYGLRMTADGSLVFVLAQTPGGIYRFPSDGSGRQQVVGTEDVAKLLGIAPNRNHWIRKSLDLSDDGSRIVFGFKDQVFAVQADGSGLRQLTTAEEYDRGANYARISGDGERVAIHVASGKKANTVTCLTWQGAPLSTHVDVKNGTWMQLSRDGKRAAVSWGLRVFDTDSTTQLNVLDTGGNYTRPVYRANHASLSADFSRAVFLVDGTLDGEKGLPQLMRIDTNAQDLAGTPSLLEIDVKPRSLLTDGSNSATVTVESSHAQLDTVDVRIMRGGIQDYRYTYYGSLRLSDDGKNGDQAAGDGVFTTDQLRLYKDGDKLAAPGPLTMRVFAISKGNEMLIADVEGLEAREP